MPKNRKFGYFFTGILLTVQKRYVIIYNDNLRPPLVRGTHGRVHALSKYAKILRKGLYT